MRIYPLYSKIIIAITEYTYGGTKKQVLPPKLIKKILEDVFQHLPKFQVILAGKAFLVRKTFDDLPKFDVVVSGNLACIRNMEKLGVKARYVERTKGIPGWSGRELREALDWG